MEKSCISLKFQTNEAWLLANLGFVGKWSHYQRNINSYTVLSSIKSTYGFCPFSLTLHCFQDLIISETQHSLTKLTVIYQMVKKLWGKGRGPHRHYYGCLILIGNLTKFCSRKAGHTEKLSKRTERSNFNKQNGSRMKKCSLHILPYDFVLSFLRSSFSLIKVIPEHFSKSIQHSSDEERIIDSKPFVITIWRVTIDSYTIKTPCESQITIYFFVCLRKATLA